MDGSSTSITLTGSTETNLRLAGNSTFTINDGTFLVQFSTAAAANIGHGGDLTFNQTGGLFHFAPTGANNLLNIGVTFTGSATLNLSGGTFRTAADVPAFLGGRVDTVMNISGTAIVDIPNLLFNRNLNTPHTATLNLGDGSPGSGIFIPVEVGPEVPSSHDKVENDFPIRTGNTPETLELFDQLGSASASSYVGYEVETASTNALVGADALNFTATSTYTDANRPLLYGKLSATQVVTDGTLEVFIDDFPATVGGHAEVRTW